MADGRATELDPRQLARPADESLEAQAHPGSDGSADVCAVGIDEVEVRAGAEVDDDGRTAELDACRQGVGEPVRAGLGGAVDPNLERPGQRAGVHDRGLDADALCDQPLPGLGQRRDDAGQRHRVELIEAMRVEGEHPGQCCGDLVGRRVGPGDGAP